LSKLIKVLWQHRDRYSVLILIAVSTFSKKLSTRLLDSFSGTVQFWKKSKVMLQAYVLPQNINAVIVCTATKLRKINKVSHGKIRIFRCFSQ